MGPELYILGGAQEAANFDLTFWIGLWVTSYTHHPITREGCRLLIEAALGRQMRLRKLELGATQLGVGWGGAWWGRGNSQAPVWGDRVGEQRVRFRAGAVVPEHTVPLVLGSGPGAQEVLTDNGMNEVGVCLNVWSAIPLNPMLTFYFSSSGFKE